MMVEPLFEQSAETVARGLIGWTFEVAGVGGRIVETEAYDADDPASHSFGGPRVRNAPMFGPVGRAYVYRIYGLHWCFNIVCDAARPGSAVLLRALEPLSGLEAMRRRRDLAGDVALCSGPGRLCEALAIDGFLNGAELLEPPFCLTPPDQRFDVVVGSRIGISRATETPGRFGLAGSPFLSRAFRS